ncbi:MAG: hypothetical protein Q8L22_07160 [Reyranella sp.]|nr:hypothetical protein [Reyranella sp.]
MDASLLADLAIPHRAKRAYRQLLGRGLDAMSTARRGLRHASADVRYRCCRFLDRFLEPGILGDLISMLEDPDHRVRLTTLHTLACDRCKEGDCRPDEGQVLPLAISLLANDPDAHVRAMAVEVVGQWAHTSSAAEGGLLAAMKSDPSTTVRKKAGWYAPGGTIHRRTAPKSRRSA